VVLSAFFWHISCLSYTSKAITAAHAGGQKEANKMKCSACAAISVVNINAFHGFSCTLRHGGLRGFFNVIVLMEK
jgi:hypothetical protein